MVASHHDGTDFTTPYEVVEGACDLGSALCIRIEDTRLGSDDELVLLGVANPLPVVAVLAAPVGVDTLHRGVVGLAQIFWFARQADPAKWSIAVVETHGPHDVFHVRGIGKGAVGPEQPFGPGPGGLQQEGIAVVPEMSALVGEPFDDLEVAAQTLVDQFLEFRPVAGQQFAHLLEGDSSRTVSTVVGHVAGGLIRDQIHRNVVLVEVFEQIDDIALVGNRQRFALVGGFEHPSHRLSEILADSADPTLGVPGFDARWIDLGDDSCATSDLERLRLSLRHAPETRSDEGVALEVFVFGGAEVEAVCVEQSDIGAVHDALGPDVHPPSGRHLSVVDTAQGGETLEIFRGVEHADHQTIGDDGSRSIRF